MKSSLTAVRQGVQTLSTDIFALNIRNKSDISVRVRMCAPDTLYELQPRRGATKRQKRPFLNPFRTAVPFWRQILLGISVEFELICPENGTEVLNWFKKRHDASVVTKEAVCVRGHENAGESTAVHRCTMPLCPEQ